ncbi:endonuclease/exonuclease/phosphatase family protein [Sphingomonas sp. PB2P12]|uniref:endonuclease/exonuclease/phosphatase family protein n=1 Tax=Sphingomonas sandaracina TaxID=3096157 RepID=UPI002FC79203
MSGRMASLVVGIAALAGSVAPAQATLPGASVSVMTYNVHGVPWPVADDRSSALTAIAAQLRAMRAAGRQPGIVALQESFVPDAKAIGAEAGYRYVAFGAPAEAIAAPETAQDRKFVADGSMLRGERVGKHVGSGLAIFSDYPILAVRRISYPVCAGYDCLANKGAMAALIAVPGIASPVAVIDTHLNSNGATGVSEPRALYAYRRQIDALSGFIRSVARPGGTMLVAGDFNVGRDMERRTYFAQHMFGGPVALTGGSLKCRESRTCLVTQPADIAFSTGRAKDFLLYRPSNGADIRPLALSAPFGRGPGNTMLSDHIGVMVNYRIDGLARPALPGSTLASRRAVKGAAGRA